MYYLFVIVIPIVVFILWIVWKDRQEKRQVMEDAGLENLTDKYAATSEYKHYKNLLKQSPLNVNVKTEDGDLDYSPEAIRKIDVRILTLGKAYAEWQRKENMTPEAEREMPDWAKLNHAVYCTGRLVRLAKMNDDTTLANILGWSTGDLPPVDGVSVFN